MFTGVVNQTWYYTDVEINYFLIYNQQRPPLVVDQWSPWLKSQLRTNI